MNEGHSAFLQLERLRELVEEQRALARRRACSGSARRPSSRRTRRCPPATRSSTPALVEQNVAPLVARCGFTLGRVRRARPRRRRTTAGFGLTPFALRTSSLRERRLGAARRGLARDVARPLARPRRSTRCRSARSRTASTRARGSPRSSTRCSAPRRTWARPTSRARTTSTTTRSGARSAHAKRGAARRSCARAACPASFDPDALTIGFARRFATYKRADLHLQRPRRVSPRLLADGERPLQIVLAGKAHPADEGGKALIQKVIAFARSPRGERPRRLPARLRDDARALPRPGRRRLAEQPAPAARGVGHLRHEGGAERRRQRLDPRRLVGRGLLARDRLRDRRRLARLERRGAGRRRRGRALRRARAARAPGVLRAGRARPAAAVARADAQARSRSSARGSTRTGCSSSTSRASTCPRIAT